MCLILVCGKISAQPGEPQSPFISAHLGGFLTSHDNFDETYGSKFGFAYGGGFGLDLSSRMYLIGKATYFTKRGTIDIFRYEYHNDSGLTITKIGEGAASYKQWIFNLGLLYNFFLSEDYTLGLDAGLTYTVIHEEYSNTEGKVTSNMDGHGLLGGFGGLVIERNFQGSPFSIFFETQVNISRNDVQSLIGNYGGENFSLGVRYYFKERRTK